MNISQVWKWAVGIAAGIGVIIGTAKSVADIAKSLNGWHVLALLSLAVLCVLGCDHYRRWLDRRFRKEADSRGGMHSTACAMIAELDKRLKALETSKR